MFRSVTTLLLAVLCVPAAFKYLLGDGTPVQHATTVDWLWLALLFPAGALLAWIWERLRQPNPWLFGPLFISAAVSIGWDLHIGLPHGASQVGQLLIGRYIPIENASADTPSSWQHKPINAPNSISFQGSPAPVAPSTR